MGPMEYFRDPNNDILCTKDGENRRFCRHGCEFLVSPSELMHRRAGPRAGDLSAPLKYKLNSGETCRVQLRAPKHKELASNWDREASLICMIST